MTKIFFNNAEDADKVSANLDVPKDCEYSITADKEEIRVAVTQGKISHKSYSIAEVETPKK